jgi:hypothetical protein
LDDDELSALLDVRPRQTINRACRALQNSGRLRRYVGPAGKIVNDIAMVDGDELVAPTTETLRQPRAGDSTAQRRAETVMIEELGRRIGVRLSPRRFDLDGGVRVEVDGADAQLTVLAEAWAHQGAPKSAQKHKVLADALRLLFVATTLPTSPRLILCLSDEAAAHHFTAARSWAAAALREFAVDVEIVDLPDEHRLAVLAAQVDQYR